METRIHKKSTIIFITMNEMPFRSRSCCCAVMIYVTECIRQLFSHERNHPNICTTRKLFQVVNFERNNFTALPCWLLRNPTFLLCVLRELRTWPGDILINIFASALFHPGLSTINFRVVNSLRVSMIYTLSMRGCPEPVFYCRKWSTCVRFLEEC